jgi:hypothetical protein
VFEPIPLKCLLVFEPSVTIYPLRSACVHFRHKQYIFRQQGEMPNMGMFAQLMGMFGLDSFEGEFSDDDYGESFNPFGDDFGAAAPNVMSLSSAGASGLDVKPSVSEVSIAASAASAPQMNKVDEVQHDAATSDKSDAVLDSSSHAAALPPLAGSKRKARDNSGSTTK